MTKIEAILRGRSTEEVLSLHVESSSTAATRTRRDRLIVVGEESESESNSVERATSDVKRP
jgi:hypothetical protein